MKPSETASTTANPTRTQRQHGRGAYLRVFDAHKRRIRGLWQRNSAFYAQLAVTDPATGRNVVRRVRLEDQNGQPVTTVAEALKRLNALKTRRDEGALKLDPKRTPTFSEYARTYLDFFESVKDLKRPNTIRCEANCLRALEESFGDLHLRQITKPVVRAHIARRQAAGLSPRTVNLEISALRNVLHRAVEDGCLTELPIEGLPWLKYTPKRKRLLSHADIERICETALRVAPISGRQFSDFVRVMSYSGGRLTETLRLRWSDIDFDRRQMIFGAEGLSKNRKSRAVDFNPKLEACLREMFGRRRPDSQFVFPSPRSGEADLPAISFARVLQMVRAKAGIEDFTCHSCRHFFASFCVMSGIDFMTVARWLGHSEGGILVGRTYGHLSAEHTQAMAQRLSFEPVVLEKQEAI